MQVDQAGHHGLAGGVDDPRIARHDRPVGHLADGVALDQDVVAVLQLGLQRIEQAGVLDEEGLGHGVCLPGSGAWTVRNDGIVGSRHNSEKFI
ncbi:hypothetical protein D3C72_2171140 [compost metagenome]